MKHFTIAIDGPGGAGKSSVAGNIARRLNVLHLDTGAMYRAFAYQAISENTDIGDVAAVEALARNIRLNVTFVDGQQHTFVNGQDVTGLIRTPQISRGASDFAVLPTVRRLMVHMQREIASKQSMVLDGRDIGTRVLPDATLKIYLTAQSEVRAKRRFDELTARGIPADYQTVLNDVIARDRQDTTRQTDPLTVAPDAVMLDTSDMSQAQVEQTILELLEKKMKQNTTGAQKVPAHEPYTLFYRLAMGLSRFLFRTVLPVRYHNVEYTRLDAPYILIGNHNSMLDPLIIGWKCERYHIRFLGKKELTKNPIIKAMFKNLLMIPVDRHNMDMQAVRACLKTLKENHVLGIFPEGTRHKKTLMEEMESGVGMIALRGDVPVLPAYITGKPKLFKAIDCYFGEPFTLRDLAQGGVNREAVETAMARIAARYREMAETHRASLV